MAHSVSPPGLRRCVLLLTLLAALHAPLGAQARGPSSAEIVAEITRLDSIWLNAYVTADDAAVRPILADDFFGQSSDTPLDKPAVLEGVAASTGVEQMVLERLVVNVYGDVAVAHAVRRRIDSTPDGPTESRFAYTDVYVLRDGRWQCITGQSALLSDP